GLVALGALAAAPRRVLSRLAGLLVPGVLAALLFAPLAWPYLTLAHRHGFARELPTGVDLRNFLSTASGNLLYGAIGGPVRLQQNAAHFTGCLPLALAGIAQVALSWLVPDEVARPADFPPAYH